MPTYSPDWIQEVTGGAWLGAPARGAAQGFTIDSRELARGEAEGFGFVAIPGPNFDGHDFVASARADGAVLAVVSDPSRLKSVRDGVLVVADTTQALQQLAAAHRDRLGDGACTVISVSGSNGKTSTRHLIHHVLTHCGKTGTQSPKSFNNHLGVPLTLLAADPDHDFVAAEIGTNHPGEIDALAAIVRPDVAVITSIGEEHLEFFKDLSGVAREELAIVDRIRRGGRLVLPQEVLAGFGDLLPQRPDVQVSVPDPLVTLNSGDLAVPHLDSNGGLAIKVATASFDLSPESAEPAIVMAAPVAGRWERMAVGSDVVIIHDAYNANPSSVRASLSFFARTVPGRRVVVLGDMLELGEQSKTAHRAVVEQVASLRTDRNSAESVDICMAIGPAMVSAVNDVAPNVFELAESTWTDDLPERVAERLQPGDSVLLKASRGLRLERLIPAIRRKFETDG